MKILNIPIIEVILIALTIKSCSMQQSQNEQEPSTYNLDQFIGIWYLVAEINQTPSPFTTECSTINITRGPDNHLIMLSQTILNGKLHKFQWKTKIVGNKMHHYSTDTDGNEPAIYSFLVQEDGELFVTYNNDNWQSYVIHSRHPTMNENALKQYRNIADSNHRYLEYIDNTNCPTSNVDYIFYDKEARTEIIGLWYMLYALCPTGFTQNNIRIRMNIKKEYNDYFSVERHEQADEWMYINQSKAKINKMKLIEVNNAVKNPSIHAISFYGNTDLILYSSEEIGCDTIWSRHRAIPIDSIHRYKKMAKMYSRQFLKIQH